MNLLEEIKMQITQLNMWTKAYDEGNPIVSDKEYDDAYFRLAKLERKSNIFLPNSPTQSISYEIKSKLEKVEHNHPMLSLDKTKDWSEFISYFNGLNSSKDIIGMVKLDGLTCSLRYINGALVSAETRGNGQIGENVLHNALTIKSIPHRINYNEELILDGEIICTIEDFKEFQEEYKNPRNFASGSIRLLDNKECERRKLTFVVWNVVKGFSDSNSFCKNLERCADLGFTVVPWTSSFDWDAADFLKKKADELGYPIDGLVGRFDDIEFGVSLGATGHHSRAAFAFKFYDETAQSYLRDIEWSMGRTGQITPIAVFEPIEMDGSVIEKASLHNINIMEETLGTPFVGQTVQVAKMNMIIPQIISAERKPEGVEVVELKIPTVCPVCGQAAHVEVSDSGTKNLICSNPQCEGKFVNILDHFAGKKGLDIKGLSLATLGKLIDWGWVTKLRDLFDLDKYSTEWKNKSGFGEKSVGNILGAIQTAKTCELNKFISSLGIPLIGSTYAKEICKKVATWEDFKEKINSHFDFCQWEGFGPEMSSALLKYDYSEANYIANNLFTIVNSLYKDNNIEQNNNINLNGMIICITGSLKHFKNRTELQNIIEQNGGKVTGTVSKNTNILINNDNTSTSSKNLSAQKYGTTILTEEEFIKKFLNFLII